MGKKAISVTLDASNLLWLKTRATAAKRRSVSDLLDAIITDARRMGSTTMAETRSVEGTVDIAADDPDLLLADDMIRNEFAASTGRAWVVREDPPRHGSPRPGRRRG